MLVAGIMLVVARILAATAMLVAGRILAAVTMLAAVLRMTHYLVLYQWVNIAEILLPVYSRMLSVEM